VRSDGSQGVIDPNSASEGRADGSRAVVRGLADAQPAPPTVSLPRLIRGTIGWRWLTPRTMSWARFGQMRTSAVQPESFPTCSYPPP